MRLAFLAFNAVAGGDRGFRSIARWDPDSSLAAVRLARQQADGVIVSIHWGYEYERRRDPAQSSIARALLDAGADVVLGHHPHVAQEITVYEGAGSPGRLVAFSLGNFAFDQAFGDTRQGLALRLFFDRQGLRAAQALPVSAGPHPRFLGEVEAAILLERVLAGQPRTGAQLAKRPLFGSSLADTSTLAFTCDQETCSPAAASPEEGSGMFTAGQVDLTGDGLPEKVRLDDQSLSIYENGVKTWESPPDWRISDLATGDPDGDGREDLLLALWKPDEKGVLRSHPFVFGYRGGRYRTVWGGSAVSRPIHEVELGDLDGDGLQELAVLEETPGGHRRTVSVWRWHGWGFRCDWRSPAGDFKNLRFVSRAERIPPQIQIDEEP